MTEIAEFKNTIVTSADIEIFKQKSRVYWSIGAHWIMKIEDDKIHFNREQFPNLAVDQFAESVLSILENMKLITGYKNE